MGQTNCSIMPIIDWLAFGVSLLAVTFVWIQVRTMQRQTLITQESEWIPEVFYNANTGQIVTYGRRLWFPEFKTEIEGVENEEGWVESSFFPPENDGNGIDELWVTIVPEKMEEFWRNYEEGSYLGKLYFKFETFTGAEYQIIYDIDIEITEDGYSISHYPDMERVLPWDRRSWWEEFKADIEPIFR